MTIGWKTKTLFKEKKMPKKLKIFSLKIHKGAGIFKRPQKFSKNYMELYGRNYR